MRISASFQAVLQWLKRIRFPSLLTGRRESKEKLVMGTRLDWRAECLIHAKGPYPTRTFSSFASLAPLGDIGLSPAWLRGDGSGILLPFPFGDLLDGPACDASRFVDKAVGFLM